MKDGEKILIGQEEQRTWTQQTQIAVKVVGNSIKSWRLHSVPKCAMIRQHSVMGSTRRLFGN